MFFILLDPVYQQWLRINHPTTEQVQENETNEVAGNSASVILLLKPFLK